MEHIFSYLSFSHTQKSIPLPSVFMLMPIAIFEFENPIIFLPNVYTERKHNVLTAADS